GQRERYPHSGRRLPATSPQRKERYPLLHNPLLARTRPQGCPPIRRTGSGSRRHWERHLARHEQSARGRSDRSRHPSGIPRSLPFRPARPTRAANPPASRPKTRAPRTESPSFVPYGRPHQLRAPLPVAAPAGATLGSRQAALAARGLAAALERLAPGPLSSRSVPDSVSPHQAAAGSPPPRARAPVREPRLYPGSTP